MILGYDRELYINIERRTLNRCSLEIQLMCCRLAGEAVDRDRRRKTKTAFGAFLSVDLQLSTFGPKINSRDKERI